MNAESEMSLVTIPVFPMKNNVAFPNLVLPITAGRPQSLAAVEAALVSEDFTTIRKILWRAGRTENHRQQRQNQDRV